MSPDVLPPSQENAKIDHLTHAVLESIKEGRLRDEIWEATTWRLDPLTEMRWRDELSVPKQLQHVYQTTDRETQAHFRLAAAYAVRGWDAEQDTAEQLTDSLYAAALLGASESIPAIIATIENPLLYDRPDDEVFEITADVGSVLHGFADIEGIKDDIMPALDRWLYDPRFEKITGQFMGAASKCSPEDYARYFQRVFDVNKALRGYFYLDAMLEMLFENVPSEIISKHLDELSLDARALLVSSRHSYSASINPPL